MPVRIYDIAKKLGIESKEVLAKAKELGIATARVPSSSLDKITAEFLEGHFAAAKPAAPPLSPPVPAPAAEEPIRLVKAPPPVPAEMPPVPLPAEPPPPEIQARPGVPAEMPPAQ